MYRFLALMSVALLCAPTMACAQKEAPKAKYDLSAASNQKFLADYAANSIGWFEGVRLNWAENMLFSRGPPASSSSLLSSPSSSEDPPWLPTTLGKEDDRVAGAEALV